MAETSARARSTWERSNSRWRTPSGQAGDRGEPPAAGVDQVIERSAEGVRRRGDLALRQLVQQTGYDRLLLGAALLGEEDPQQPLLECGAGLQRGHAVVAEGPAQTVLEERRQPFALDVERAEIAVEELPWAPDLRLVGGAPLGRHGQQVGERLEDLQPAHVRPSGLAAGNGDRALSAGRFDVEAEHERPEGAERVTAGGLSVGRRLPVQLIESHPVPERCVVSGLALRLDPEQRRPGVDLHVAGDEHVAHPSADRCRHRDLHLHRLDDPEPPSGGHDVVGSDVDGHDQRRRRRPDDAGVVTGEAVGDPVDLDEVVAPLHRRHDAELAVTERQPAASAPEALDVDDGDDAVQLDRRPPEGEPAHPDRVRLAAGSAARGSGRCRRRPVAVLGSAQPRNDVRSSSAGRSPASSAAATSPTSAWCVGTCWSVAVRRSSHDVSMSPARTSGRSSRSSRNDLFVVPPLTMTVICDSARCSRASASGRLRPWAMTLAIIESYSGGMTSPSATPVSTRMPGPTGSVSVSIVPGAGAKPCWGSSALRRASMA